MTRYYEDIEVGESEDCGSYTVTKEEIIGFAETYDPQPIHVDEEAANDSFFGGLIASGWQAAALCMRLTVPQLNERAFVGARGVDDLRWIRPLRPGDTLSVELEVVAKEPDDNPALGRVNTRTTGYDQNGEAVVTYVGLGLVERRDAADGN